MKIIDEENNALKIDEVKVRQPVAEDFIRAEKIAGKSTGFEFALALMSLVATFDGEKKVFEDLKQLSFDDFFLLSQKVMGDNLMGSENQLSTSQDTAE